MAWSANYGGVAPVLPNYSTGSATFIKDMWDTLIKSYNLDNWYPNLFCSKDAPTPP